MATSDPLDEHGHPPSEEVNVETKDIPEVFLSDDYISNVYYSEGCTLPSDFLEFEYSYGYDCNRSFNLCVVDENTIIFPSGNIIHIFDVLSRELKFRRSAGGGGIGHITKNPVCPHVAVGEKGAGALLIIYQWPSWEICRILKTDTAESNVRLAYSPDGRLLCSYEGAPDFKLTIWDWEKSEKQFQHKAYGRTVINSLFSTYIPGQFVSSGSGYIQFWKIAKTFTGQKLIGELGRFGKTPSSDIMGFLPMPDGKVVSGCDWGNILLWKDGLINVEVSRRNNKPCHTVPITQLEYYDGELTTVGMDGIVKYWYFETIDQADLPDDNRILELEAMYEFKIGYPKTPARLMGMLRRKPHDIDDAIWFAQDGNGGIWRAQLDLNVDIPRHEQLLFCHAGPVRDMAASPQGTYLASLGVDGRVYLYNYAENTLVIRKQFAGQGCRILWLPNQGDTTVLVMGFADGVLRLVAVTLADITLLQAIKPHSSPITALTVNSTHNLVVTGSEDGNIFICVVQLTDNHVNLIPVGFVTTPSAVTFITWKPNTARTVLVCCKNSYLMELELTETPPAADAVSYELKDIMHKTRQLKGVHHDTPQKVTTDKLHGTKAELSGEYMINEDTLVDKSKSEEVAHSPVLFAAYTDASTILISMGGCESGFLYEYNFDQEDAINFTKVPEAEGIEMDTCAFYHNRKYLAMGMCDGHVRVARVNPVNASDVTDYLALAMHDNTNGKINRICFSADQRYMFTCGEDGNIFSFRVHPEDSDYAQETEKLIIASDRPCADVSDIKDPTILSLEEMKKKLEYDREINVANERKSGVMNMLLTLEERFFNLAERNRKLPESQRIPAEAMEIDGRITASINDTLQAEMDLLKREMEYQMKRSELGLKKIYDYFINKLESTTISVLAIDKDWHVSTFRHTNMSPDYLDTKQQVEKSLKRSKETDVDWDENIYRVYERGMASKSTPQVAKKFRQTDVFLKRLDMQSAEFQDNVVLKRMMASYLDRKQQEEVRQAEWAELINARPDPNSNDPNDDLAIKEAEKNTGDYKLKSEENFCVPKSMHTNTVKKYNEMLEARERSFKAKSEFNKKVFSLRKKKIDLIEQIKSYHKTIDSLLKEQPDCVTEQAPHGIPTINAQVEMADEEFKIKPRENLRIEYERETTKTVQSMDTAEDQRSSEIEYDIRSIAKAISSEPCYVAPVSEEKLMSLNNEDMTDTPWETEAKNLQTLVFTGQYEQLCQVIDRKIERFDATVHSLAAQRRVIEIKAKYLDLHVLKLNMELIILRKCEAGEEYLTKKLSKRLKDAQGQHLQVVALEEKIAKINKEITELSEKQAEVTATLTEATAESKFSTFLRRIYKKKYKPPTQKNDDGAEEDIVSTDGSVETEDEDLSSSDDSDSTGVSSIIKMDESICPDGCEVVLYDLAFNLREERYQNEIKISELTIQEEVLERNLEKQVSKLKDLEEALQANQNELEEFQREKQRLLNQIDVLVIVKMDCISNIVRNGFESMDRMLLFSKPALEQLNEREKELVREMVIHKDNHKLHRQHLKRMKQDCSYMNDVIEALNNEIKEWQMRKFGMEISLDELEEAVLKRLVTRVRSPIVIYKKEQEKNITELQQLIFERQNTLCCAIRDHTEKLNTMRTLEKEKQSLSTKLLHQKDLLQSSLKENPYIEDNKKLQEIISHQSLQIKNLKEEVKALGHKTRPLAPIIGMPGIPISEQDQTCVGLSTQKHTSLKETRSKAKRVQTQNGGAVSKVASETYIQALIEEVIQALPDTAECSMWETEGLMATTGLKQLMEQLLLMDDQSRAQQMMYEVIELLPVKAREEFLQMEQFLGNAKDIAEQDVISSDVINAVKKVLVTLLDSPIEMKGILKDIMDEIKPLGVKYGINFTQMVAQTIDEFSTNYLPTPTWVIQVAKSLKSQSKLPPDITNVRAVCLDILKMIVLEKISTRAKDLGEVPLLASEIYETSEMVSRRASEDRSQSPKQQRSEEALKETTEYNTETKHIVVEFEDTLMGAMGGNCGPQELHKASDCHETKEILGVKDTLPEAVEGNCDPQELETQEISEVKEPLTETLESRCEIQALPEVQKEDPRDSFE